MQRAVTAGAGANRSYRRWLRVAIEHYLATWVGKFIRFSVNAKQIADSSNIYITQFFFISPRHRLAVHCGQRHAGQLSFF
ncbi:TPA: hypothetical protein ACHGUG_003546 [Klebsiella pneumoniae]